MKRPFCILLAVVTMFGTFVLNGFAAAKMPSEKSFIQKITALEKKYPTGSKWTDTYKENGYSYASQCRGYVNLLAYEIFGSSEYTGGGSWSKSTSMGTLCAGDMVRISNSKGPDGHSIFITKADGNDIYFTDCNWIATDTVRWDGHYTKSELKARFNYKIHLTGNSLTGTHICDKSKNLGPAKEHPHYTEYVCSICGKTWEDENEPNLLLDICGECQPTPETPTLQIDVNKQSVTFCWNECKNANYYDLCVNNYDGTDFSMYGISGTSCTLELEPGSYYAYCRAAYSDMKYSECDEICFDVCDKSCLDYAVPVAAAEYDGNMYELYRYSVDWHTANEWCRAKNAHLATISSKEEKNAVDLLISGCGFHGQLWLGATVSFGNIVWMDGSDNSYKNWADSQPCGKYVYIDTDLSNSWMSGNSNLKCFILERDSGNANPDDFEYEITDADSVKITGYCGNLQALNLPSTLFGKTVTSIGSNAFDGANIYKITVPESVTDIDEFAFGCNFSNGFTIRCVESSAAYDFALKSGISYELIDTSVVYGDVNGDGNIDMRDVLFIRKHIAKQPIELNLDASDVTCDGAVDLRDVLLIRKYIAKQPVLLGPHNLGRFSGSSHP